MNDDHSQGRRDGLMHMISCAERELATRRSILETHSQPGGNAYRRRKAAKEIKQYEAHIEDLKRDLQRV